MRVLVGTSGYQYAAWRGSLYTATCKEREMLAAYSRVLTSVEINNTFYRMPTANILARWAQQVSSEFRFAIKAPKRITHVLRLRGARAPLAQLFTNLEQLGDKLGCVLFQLPPYLPKDAALLRAFLLQLPSGVRVSFEFRHDSWFDAEVLDVLRAHGAALCMVDVLDAASEPRATSDFGYLRLRREVYSDDELNALRDKLSAQGWRDVYAYFKSEDDAPALAARLAALFEPPRPGLTNLAKPAQRLVHSDKVAS